MCLERPGEDVRYCGWSSRHDKLSTVDPKSWTQVLCKRSQCSQWLLFALMLLSSRLPFPSLLSEIREH